MTVSNERPRRCAAEPIRAPRDEDACHHLSPLDAIVKLTDIGTIFGNFLCKSRAPACLVALLIEQTGFQPAPDESWTRDCADQPELRIRGEGIPKRSRI